MAYSIKNAGIILAVAVAGICHAEPGVHAVLTEVRCIYLSPHDGSGRRMELQVELQATEEGWQVNEAGTRLQRIRGRDQTGKYHESTPCTWEKKPSMSQVCVARIVFPLQTRVEYLDVNEDIQVRIARQATCLPQQDISMLEPCLLKIPGEERGIRCVPDSSNAATSNADPGGVLRRAGIRFHCPAGISILRVSRIWTADSKAVGEEANGGVGGSSYTQDLEIRQTVSAKGESVTSVVLWDAMPTERLEVEICRDRRSVHVPLKCRATLGKMAGRKGTPAG